jgi:hypothetical protein
VLNPNLTQQQLNRIIEFRQAVHRRFLTRQRDAQFELIDALLLSRQVRSFPQLSLSPVFRRRWPSIYTAVEDGRQDVGWLRGYLLEQVPTQERQIFSLDGTAWPRPQSPTLPDRQYVYSPTPAIDGGSIVVGYPYSILAWVTDVGSSWALPIDIERISSQQTAVEMGIAQVRRLCELRQPHLATSLHIIVADGKYGNHRYLGPLRNLNCGLLVRMRCDRVLYGTPDAYSGRGRPRVHGDRFAFKEPDTWHEPDQLVELEHPKWGQVEIRLWKGLHARDDANTRFAVLRIQVHLERDRPPKPLWLAWIGPDLAANELWTYYQHRWPVEPSIRWRKQQLLWTQPQFQDPQVGDRWTHLVTLAQWMLYLARPLVSDQPLPWQVAQPPGRLTPGRVQLGLAPVFALIGTPAAPPQTRGKSPGWPKGRKRTRAKRYAVVKKTAASANSARKAA